MAFSWRSLELEFLPLDGKQDPELQHLLKLKVDLKIRTES